MRIHLSWKRRPVWSHWNVRCQRVEKAISSKVLKAMSKTNCLWTLRRPANNDVRQRRGVATWYSWSQIVSESGVKSLATWRQTCKGHVKWNMVCKVERWKWTGCTPRAVASYGPHLSFVLSASVFPTPMVCPIVKIAARQSRAHLQTQYFLQMYL